MDNSKESFFFISIADAIAESGDDPEVIRAKYFIRDEFLVSPYTLNHQI